MLAPWVSSGYGNSVLPENCNTFPSLCQCFVPYRSRIILFSYHRLTRANTPASAPLRRFLPFSPWRAPARLRLKNQKALGNPSLAGAKQFCRAEMCPDKERPAGNTCRISKGLDAVWAYFCPSKPCLPLSTDGMKESNQKKSAAIEGGRFI